MAEGWFSTAAQWCSYHCGRPHTFIGNLVMILLWLCAGPFFGFSDTWQLWVNTATTVITYLMVFLLQNSLNKDTLALQLKIDALIAASGAQNRMIVVDSLSEAELRDLKARFEKLSGGFDGHLG
jgi:low affinity Fe/Cu permease